MSQEMSVIVIIADNRNEGNHSRKLDKANLMPILKGSLLNLVYNGMNQIKLA